MREEADIGRRIAAQNGSGVLSGVASSPLREPTPDRLGRAQPNLDVSTLASTTCGEYTVTFL